MYTVMKYIVKNIESNHTIMHPIYAVSSSSFDDAFMLVMSKAFQNSFRHCIRAKICLENPRGVVKSKLMNRKQLKVPHGDYKFVIF